MDNIYSVFVKKFSPPDGDYWFFSLVSLSIFRVSVLTFSFLLFILVSLLYPTIFLYCGFFVLFSSLSLFFDKQLLWDVVIYNFVGSKCCFSIV